MMRNRLVAVAAGALLLGAAAAAGEFAFTAKPTATRAGDKVKISFAVSVPTDVAVYVEDAKGEVVRHLVAGVLGGTNPPPAPLKPGLAQEVEWDGKADYGKPAEGGPFKVRVGLGLGAKYDRVAHSILPALFHAAAIAAAPDGTLYASTSGLYSLAGDRWRLFGRDGSYQGTWGVPPGPDAARYFGWTSNDGRPDPMNYKGQTAMTAAWVFNAVSGSDAVVIGRDGADLFQIGGGSPPCLYRYPLTATCPKDDKFSVSLEGSGAGGLLGDGLNPQGCLAISSDGKTLFVGGLADKAKKPLAAVWAVKCPERTGCRVLFGDPAKAGNDEKSLGGAPGGLAVDGQGRLFVADEANNRVAVLDEKDGKYLGEIGTEKPVRIGCAGRTGALYVLAREGRAYALRRFNLGAGADARGWKALKPEAAMPVRDAQGYLAVDGSASPTVIWIGGGWGPTLRIEDSGTGPKFGDAKPPTPKPATGTWCQDNVPFGNLMVDRLRKEIYCRVGGNGRSQARYSEKTGEAELVEFAVNFMQGGGTGLQVAPAPNGNVYGVQWPKQFYQWGRDGKPLAWAEPRKVTEEEYKIGPHCGKPDDKLAPHEATVSVAMGVLPHTLTARWSDGHIFNIEPFRWQGQSVGGRTHKALHEYLPSGKKVTPNDGPIIWKLSDAAVGPRFDAAGNIYVAEAVRPTDWIMPADLAAYYAKKGVEVKLNGARGGWYSGYKGVVGVAAHMYGSILKFGPKGGMVHWDKDPKKGPQGCGQEPYVGEPKLDPSLKTVEVEYGGEYIRYVKVTGAEWIHPGMSHVGFFGCNCENVTFEVDEFGRVFFPDPAQFRVCVIDTAGNALTKFGGYGDANCMGPESSVVDPKTNRVRARRPDDPKDLKSPFAEPEIAFSWLVGVGVTDRYAYLGDSLNQRLLRARLTYAAEETCEVK